MPEIGVPVHVGESVPPSPAQGQPSRQQDAAVDAEDQWHLTAVQQSADPVGQNAREADDLILVADPGPWHAA
jgi:hypothetical protein